MALVISHLHGDHFGGLPFLLLDAQLNSRRSSPPYFFDKTIKWHLSYATLHANLGRLDAKRIIATHMSADVLGRLDDVAIETAHDGLVVEL